MRNPYKITYHTSSIAVHKNILNWYFPYLIGWIIFFSFDILFIFYLLLAAPLNIHNIYTIIGLIVVGGISYWYMQKMGLHLDRHISPIVMLENSNVIVLDEEGHLHKNHFTEFKAIHGQVYSNSETQYLEIYLKYRNGDHLPIDTIYNHKMKYDSKYEIVKGLKSNASSLTNLLSEVLEIPYYINNSIETK